MPERAPRALDATLACGDDRPLHRAVYIRAGKDTCPILVWHCAGQVNRSGGNVVIISMAYRLKNSKFDLFSEAKKHNLLFCQRLYQVNGYPGKACTVGVPRRGAACHTDHSATRLGAVEHVYGRGRTVTARVTSALLVV